MLAMVPAPSGRPGGGGRQERTGSTSTRSRPGGRGTDANRCTERHVVGSAHRPRAVDGAAHLHRRRGGRSQCGAIGLRVRTRHHGQRAEGGKSEGQAHLGLGAGEHPGVGRNGGDDGRVTRLAGLDDHTPRGPVPRRSHRRHATRGAPREPGARAPAPRPESAGRAAPSRTPRTPRHRRRPPGATQPRCPPRPGLGGPGRPPRRRPPPDPTPRPPPHRSRASRSSPTRVTPRRNAFMRVAPQCAQTTGRSSPQRRQRRSGGPAPAAGATPGAVSTGLPRRGLADELERGATGLTARQLPARRAREQPHPSRPVDDAHHPAPRLGGDVAHQAHQALGEEPRARVVTPAVDDLDHGPAPTFDGAGRDDERSEGQDLEGGTRRNRARTARRYAGPVRPPPPTPPMWGHVLRDTPRRARRARRRRPAVAPERRRRRALPPPHSHRRAPWPSRRGAAPPPRPPPGVDAPPWPPLADPGRGRARRHRPRRAGAGPPRPVPRATGRRPVPAGRPRSPLRGRRHRPVRSSTRARARAGARASRRRGAGARSGPPTPTRRSARTTPRDRPSAMPPRWRCRAPRGEAPSPARWRWAATPHRGQARHRPRRPSPPPAVAPARYGPGCRRVPVRPARTGTA